MASDTLWKGYVLPQNTQSSGGVSRRGGASAQSRGSSSARCRRRLAAWSHHFPPKVTTNQKRVVLFFLKIANRHWSPRLRPAPRAVRANGNCAHGVPIRSRRSVEGGQLGAWRWTEWTSGVGSTAEARQ